jgi:hypothetical protein
MLPIKHQSIFKSRWIALLWASGIIWSAVEFTGGLPGADTTNNQSAADESNADAAALQGAINTLQGMR